MLLFCMLKKTATVVYSGSFDVIGTLDYNGYLFCYNTLTLGGFLF